MPYELPKSKVVLFFSPKGAGTSIRAFLFQLENGYPFRPFLVEGKEHTANDLLRNKGFSRVDHERIADWRRFAVVRDPVRRFLSGYSNRVIHYRELSEENAGEELKRRNLVPDPDIDTFVKNLRAYGKAQKQIRRHVMAQDHWLGTDKSYYERVFPIEEIGALQDEMNAIHGTSFEFPREQTGGPKMSFDDLSEEARAGVVAHVSDSAIFDWVPAYRERYAAYFPADASGA